MPVKKIIIVNQILYKMSNTNNIQIRNVKIDNCLTLETFLGVKKKFF